MGWLQKQDKYNRFFLFLHTFETHEPYAPYEEYLSKIEKDYNFKDGKRDGIGKTYYENGRLKSTETYKTGQEINRKHYDTKGNLIE